MSGAFINKIYAMSVATASIIAIMAGSTVAYAQSFTPSATPSKGWTDPGAQERAKTQPAADQSAATPPSGSPNGADSSKNSAAKSQSPAAPAEMPKTAITDGKASAPADQKQKQTATDREKLKDLIHSSEAPILEHKEKHKAFAHKSRSAVHHASAKASKGAKHVHAAAPKRVAVKFAKMARPRHIAYENLPNKKDGPVAPELTPFNSQPISAAY